MDPVARPGDSWQPRVVAMLDRIFERACRLGPIDRACWDLLAWPRAEGQVPFASLRPPYHIASKQTLRTRPTSRPRRSADQPRLVVWLPLRPPRTGPFGRANMHGS